MITGIRTHVFIGDFEALRTPEILIESERHTCLGRAVVTLPDPTGEVYQSVSVGDPVEIRLGFRDQAPGTWSGTVEWIKPGTKDQVMVGAVDKARPLSSTRIIQAWENETPEAIIRFAISRAGLSVGRVDSPGVVFPRFAASDVSPWQIARQCALTCQRAFGLDMSRWALWLGQDGVNWGDFDEPGDGPEITTYENLIEHRPADDKAAWSRVETFLLPGFRHSQTFTLNDVRRGVVGEFRAQRVETRVKANSVRTVIFYGEEYDRI